jgi:hypothetical protein
MGIIDAIDNIASGGIKGLVLGVLDRIKLNPEEKAKIQVQLEQNSFELQKLQMELEAKEKEQIAKEIEAASANIRAEAQSGDKYTARARPTFLHMVMLILGWNYIVAPLLHLELPEPLFWLFRSAVLGYTGARTWEKVGVPKLR